MELMTLNATMQASKLIENYDSLIWAERFNTVGDFQLTVGKDIDKFMTLLPEGTMLTLRESNVAMQVETHQIERKKNTPAKLTITGRSWESILDRRVAVPGIAALTANQAWSVNARTPLDLAYWAIYNICVVGGLTTADIFETAKVQFPAPADYGTSTGPIKNMEIPRGNLLSVVLQFLQTETPADLTTVPPTPAFVPHGIRAVRPNSAGTAVAIQIYIGTDRSATVYFDATRDLLDDGTYLFSKVNSATTAYGIGNNIATIMQKANVGGLARRVILVDAADSNINNMDRLKAQMQQSLSEAHETAVFDGSINNDLSPYVYGIDYNLGDIVKVVGDYGLEEKARVTEYIRSVDKTGSKAYPTLTAIDT